MSETAQYIPVLILLIFTLLIGGVMLLLPRLIARRRPTPEKNMAYECGKDPIGSPRERFSIAFYLVAMIFILFDIEAIFLIPWAVVFHDLAAEFSKAFVFVEMMIFIAILLVGYVYVWKKGTFDWNR
ncbi:MAG: NADH-quinone oxidoreductase subunit A [Acidobacteriota bacterium]|nr:NADH-quinone oxidoreductase subunit A [Blastocatellia bacterium]MDW8238372.1 NADH-quinone oxidoreductase subunit A [Acidobacteriota bacterium]